LIVVAKKSSATIFQRYVPIFSVCCSMNGVFSY
jgi:hypothetical protein